MHQDLRTLLNSTGTCGLKRPAIEWVKSMLLTVAQDTAAAQQELAGCILISVNNTGIVTTQDSNYDLIDAIMNNIEHDMATNDTGHE